MSHNRSYPSLSLMFIGTGAIVLGIALWLALTPGPRDKKLLAVPGTADFPAPDLALFDLNGESNSLAALRGKVILVNLWATWCPPCKEEMPVLNKFFLKHHTQGFEIIGINDGEQEALVRKFVEDYDLQFPIWLDPDYDTEKAFGTINLPSSYVINRLGSVRLMWFGAVDFSTLEKFVSPMILE